jgi:hypothetical protein
MGHRSFLFCGKDTAIAQHGKQGRNGPLFASLRALIAGASEDSPQGLDERPLTGARAASTTEIR